ncbi:acyl-CoA dehydrogenase [Streptomyces sp. WAC05374]|uniref:acyl-CoA dehydrogenase family protein n=1 Tax=Streptomyces sp. WAC05374 TaxID=2487420 RepID=UPI000F890497|nr:acyl-CoA dehydrogenase family protein [Streptomyces sp. WAC05374]RST08540.1 acyl-CoA dehydrogenase [Streptomyces sp. WAC05374]TDF44631.1 acyl-CoA dehydrogenase [Streptomyces sp. WAC05374]TDF56670.1 acyl-CoA dehydrogenase [Streptomyces sp. WAC05374]TDF59954.1 acyl-CoA dehydrogenase [Streptomyces sp. WAC05374]
MDFTFSEEQQAAVEAAKAVFSGVAPDGVPSPALTPGAVAEDFDRMLWDRLAAADLLSLVLAPAHGGAGLDPVALCLVLRESSRVLARVPLLETSAVAMAVERFGHPDMAAEVLPPVGRGELVLTVGANGRSGHDPAEAAVTARRDGDHWLLDGVQTAVPWARSADRVALPAHTPDGRVVIALVSPGHEGVALADQVSTSGEALAEVRLDSVRVPARAVIDHEGAWEWLRGLLTTGTCALALGLGEAVLAMTAAYTGKREQFGFPIATFQAVAVQAADRYIDLRAMEVTLWQAAWRIGSGATGALPASGDIAVAKIWASEGVRRVVQTAQHLHGGFGADTDYALHRYHAWAKQLELSLGPAAAHEEALGDLLAAHPLS